MRLVQIDQPMPVALGAVQQALEPLDKGLPPLRVGPSKELCRLFPRELEAVQGRTDRLAAKQAAEALPHVGDQAPEGPARGRVGAYYGGEGCGALGSVHDLAEVGLDLCAKGGRPPVRR